MEHELTLEPGGRWVDVRYFGPVSLASLKALHDTMLSQSWWSPDRPRLFDYEYASIGEIGFLEASEELLPYLKGRREGLFSDGPVLQAHVCSDPLKAVMLQYWMRLAETGLPVRNRIFDRRLEAEDWLVDSLDAAEPA